MTEPDIKKSSEPELKRVNVDSWPDMNFPNWKKWGFNMDEVIRIPRRHFLLQPGESFMYEKDEPAPSLVIKGELYPVSDSMERRMENIVWPIYFVGVLLIAGMLKAAMSGMGIAAALAFLAIYILFEGFTIILLRIVGKNIRMAELEIQISSIEKVAFLPRQGIVLIVWLSDSIRKSIAIKISQDVSDGFINRLSPLIENKLTVYKSLTLSQPPT
jgi:hypothetical protein